MIYDLPMPSLGADMDEAKMIEWKIKLGDIVKKNQTIASVETTKSVIDVESFHEGKIMELVAKIGDVIKVGRPILKMETSEEIVAPSVARIKISPAAKKLAEENHINISSLKGTGNEGEITLKDVQNLVSVKPEKTHTGVDLREAIASLMTKSKKEIPHYYLHRQVCLDTFMQWIDKKNKSLPVDDRILVPAAMMMAVIYALKKFPDLNGYFKNGRYEKQDAINLGVAFSVKGGGVMAPAVLECGQKNLMDFNKSFLDLADRTRKASLKSRELSEGTITVTNVGDLGSDQVYGVIFPPQVALIGLGRIRKGPVVDGDIIKSGFVIDITLSADHRVSDGLYGSRFLKEIEHILNEPFILE